MDDAISRADVEQTVEDNILCYTHSDRAIDQDTDTECHMAIRMALRMLRKDLRKLPSAQPKPIHINLNEWVKVKLTDLGKDIYYHRCDELNKAYGREIVKPSFPREDKDGYTRFQLWEFIQLYGAHFGMGAPSVVDPLEIVFVRGRLL